MLTQFFTFTKTLSNDSTIPRLLVCIRSKSTENEPNGMKQLKVQDVELLKTRVAILRELDTIELENRRCLEKFENSSILVAKILSKINQGAIKCRSMEKRLKTLKTLLKDKKGPS